MIFCAGELKGGGDSLNLLQANVAMVINLCQALLRQPVPRLIFLSSAGVFGETVNGRLNERNPPCPTTYYGLSKLMAELLLSQVLQETSGTSCAILRPSVVYGPGDTSAYTPSGFLQAALSQARISVWGDGSEVRDFLYISDLLLVIEKLLVSKKTGIIHVCSGHTHSIKEALSLIQKILSCPIVITRRKRTRPKVNHLLSSSRLKEITKGHNFVSLADGLKETWLTCRKGPTNTADT